MRLAEEIPGHGGRDSGHRAVAGPDGHHGGYQRPVRATPQGQGRAEARRYIDGGVRQQRDAEADSGNNLWERLSVTIGNSAWL